MRSIFFYTPHQMQSQPAEQPAGKLQQTRRVCDQGGSSCIKRIFPLSEAWSCVKPLNPFFSVAQYLRAPANKRAANSNLCHGDSCPSYHSPVASCCYSTSRQRQARAAARTSEDGSEDTLRSPCTCHDLSLHCMSCLI